MDVFLELGIVVHPYDPSTQKDQMFKASLGFEKREKKIKNMEEKISDVERTGFYFVFAPPPFYSIPTCESKSFFLDVVCLLWCPLVPSISLPMSGRHSSL